MKRVAVSIGDLNGIGIEIALLAHSRVKEFCEPLYIVDEVMLKEALKLLKLKAPEDFNIVAPDAKEFQINPGKIDKASGAYSFKSFLKAINLAKTKEVDALCTLPIHKKAWELAGVKYRGHTDALRDIFKKDAIMMLGSKELFVALYTEHIPLKDVAKYIQKERLKSFLLNFYKEVKPPKVATLGLNPHAGDGGVLGDEERVISKAINEANATLGKEIFTSVLVPDIAFTPKMRQKFKYYVALYHDQGLIPLKALYFDESINISLNLPILRTSVDHGTAFDIAYKGKNPNLKSYINAMSYASKS